MEYLLWNALCLQNFQKPIKLPTGYYGIPLKNSLYKVSHVPTIAETSPSIMVIAFFFHGSATLTQPVSLTRPGLTRSQKEPSGSNPEWKNLTGLTRTRISAHRVNPDYKP